MDEGEEEEAVLAPLTPDAPTQAQIGAFETTTVTQLFASSPAGEVVVTRLVTALKQGGATKTLQATQVDLLLDRMIAANRIMVTDRKIFKI